MMMPLLALSSSAQILHEALDSMAHLHGVSGHFKPSFVAKLDSCMAKYELTKSTTSFWDGFVTYALSNGTLNDPWYENKTHHPWIEFNTTVSDLHNITIFEPCNWVSNVAYYRTLVSVCDKSDWTLSPAAVKGLAQGFALLGSGSAFYHASGTTLGCQVDNIPISILAYLAHQQALAALPWSPIIHELVGTTPSPIRNGTGIQYAGRVRQSLWRPSQPQHFWQSDSNADKR